MRGMPTAHLPPSIEIFRPGRHTDDQGVVHEFAPSDLAGIAGSYDPALREAPLTVGHPTHDRPAYGWVERVHVNADGRLAITARDVEPQFAEMVAARRFPKRSAAFYPPTHPNNPTPGRWYLRHVGFLGAQPPAIAGLKDIQFADDADGLVCFSEAHASPIPERRIMTEEEKAALARAEKAEAEAKSAAAARTQAESEAAEAKAALAQFAEKQRTERHAGFVSFAEQQVQAGRLLPKDQAAAVAVLDVLADAQPVEFAEAGATKTLTPAEWLKGLIAGAKPVVSFGEHAPGNAGGAQGAPATDEELDARAKDYATKHNVCYADALKQVVSFTA